jgi:AraC family transcriptional regulator
MSPADQAADRIYARPPHFSIHYRAGRRLRWSSEARSDYAALLLLEGRIRWHSADLDSEARDKNAERNTRDSNAGRETRAANAGGRGARSASARHAGRDSSEITGGSALLAAPGDVLSAASVERAECVLVTLSPVFVLDCATRAHITRPDSVITFRARSVEGDARLARLARDLFEELLEEATGQELVVGALVEQTLVHLLRRYSSVRRSDQLELSRAGLVDRRIRLAVELMQANLGRELALEEIASAAHLSPFHFARLFKKLTGTTPHAYLASLRAARAQALLAETDLSVTEIGARVGYMSSSHFAKAFRQSTGLSPRAFRKALVKS